MEELFLGLSVDQWIKVGVALISFFVVLFFWRPIISFLINKTLRRLTKKTETILYDLVLEVIQLPLYFLALILVLDIAFDNLQFITSSWGDWVDDLFFILYLVVTFFFLGRFLNNLFIWYGEEIAKTTSTDLDEQLIPFFRRVAMIIIGMVAIIILLSHFNVDITALVTTLGIGSLAIALAAQESLKDTISGFMIMLDRPFRIGDRIEIQDLNTWGDVVDVGLRSTRIRTRDNRMVIVPNSVIGKSLVVNYSYPDTQYRIQIHIGLAYGTDIETAREIIVDTVRNVEGVLEDKLVEALFLEFGDSALIFRVRWWLDSYYDARRMFDRVNSALYYALTKAGIEIPNPQLDVILKEHNASANSG